MNSPVDPALIQLVQQELKSLQDDVQNMSAECDKEKSKIQSELQNCVSILEEMQQRMERLEIRQQNTESEIGDVKGRISAIEDTVFKPEGNFKATMSFRAVQHSLYSQCSQVFSPVEPYFISLFYGVPCTFI